MTQHMKSSPASVRTRVHIPEPSVLGCDSCLEFHNLKVKMVGPQSKLSTYTSFKTFYFYYVYV